MSAKLTETERKFYDKAIACGVRTHKHGLPDFLILSPHKRPFFVEVKRCKNRVSGKWMIDLSDGFTLTQIETFRFLSSAGFDAYVCGLNEMDDSEAWYIYSPSGDPKRVTNIGSDKGRLVPCESPLIHKEIRAKEELVEILGYGKILRTEVEEILSVLKNYDRLKEMETTIGRNLERLRELEERRGFDVYLLTCSVEESACPLYSEGKNAAHLMYLNGNERMVSVLATSRGGRSAGSRARDRCPRDCPHFPHRNCRQVIRGYQPEMLEKCAPPADISFLLFGPEVP